MDIEKDLGKRLKVLRQRKGLDRKQLAEKAGVADSWLFRLERGEREPGKPISPTIRVLASLATALGVPLKELINGKPSFKSHKIESLEEELVNSFRKMSLESKESLVQVARRLR